MTTIANATATIDTIEAKRIELNDALRRAYGNNEHAQKAQVLASEINALEDQIASATATTDRNLYGAVESNGLVDGNAYHNAVDYSRTYSLSDLQKAGGKISRLRILTEYIPHARVRMADVSYCHGILPNGKIVPVDVYITGVNFFKFKGELISLAKAEGVFAKGIGLLDEANWSVLR